MQLEKSNLFKVFISIRPKFEEFLLKFDYLIQQIFRKYRKVSESYEHIKDFYFAVMEELKHGKTPAVAVETLIKTPKYKYLSLQSNGDEVTSEEFTRERKSAVYIKEALSSAPKCNICGGYIHTNSITIDHKKRKEDGGIGSIENGQITHPYCNTTLKN